MKSYIEQDERVFEVYYRESPTKLVWANSFYGTKDNRRAAKYWIEKMKKKGITNEWYIIEKEN